MAKKKIKEEIDEILKEFLEESNLELWNVEFVKEVKDWFLRVYIDKIQTEEDAFMGIEECEKTSRFLSERLDELDIIEQNYYLEVSSPGMDRELITEDHFNRYIGNLIDLKLYKAINGSKNLNCVLTAWSKDGIEVELEDGSELNIEKAQIAKTRLAIVF